MGECYNGQMNKRTEGQTIEVICRGSFATKNQQEIHNTYIHNCKDVMLNLVVKQEKNSKIFWVHEFIHIFSFKIH